MLLCWDEIFPWLCWSGSGVGAWFKQLSSIRLVHIHKMPSSVTVRLNHFLYSLTIFHPLHSATTGLHLQLEVVATSEHLPLQIVCRECCGSHADVIEEDWFEGHLGK